MIDLVIRECCLNRHDRVEQFDEVGDSRDR